MCVIITTSVVFVATHTGSAEENRQLHMVKHAPASSPAGRTAEVAGAARLVADILTARIDAGELKPGEQIKKIRLTRQLNVSRFAVDAAVDDLISAGRLSCGTYSGTVTVVTEWPKPIQAAPGARLTPRQNSPV